MKLSDYRPAFGQVQQGRLVHFYLLSQPVKPVADPPLKEEDVQCLKGMALRAKKHMPSQLLICGQQPNAKVAVAAHFAEHLKVPVLRVDVASLVGEYDEQAASLLYRVLADGKTHGWVLFFDEADSLFQYSNDKAPAQQALRKLLHYQGMCLFFTGQDVSGQPSASQISHVIRY